MSFRLNERDGYSIMETVAPLHPTPHHDAAGRFVHHCHCGKWGDFGYGVRLLDGMLGKWYCREHRPG